QQVPADAPGGTEYGQLHNGLLRGLPGFPTVRPRVARGSAPGQLAVVLSASTRRSLMICCWYCSVPFVSAGRGGERRAAAVADGSIGPAVPGRGAAARAGGRQPGARW